MNKNNMFSEKPASKGTAMPVHPVWRGIGFIMIILIPALSYVASLRLLELNGQYGWYPIPPEFLIFYRNLDPYIGIKVGVTLVISFIVYTVFLMITYFLNTLFGPRRYIPPDIAPLKKKKKNDWFF
jgi:hypothetical protein